MVRPGRLRDKVCIVTGSSSGLGRAISLAFSKEGALLVCTDLQQNARAEVPEEAEIATHDLIQQQRGAAIFVETDVAEAEQVEKLIQATVKHYGRLDV
jgi:NAD(P)-dependent dehydrogenase (short-subunit alcohol dehydrogenase family)